MSNRYDTDYEPVTAPEPATLPTEHDRSRRSLLGRLLAPLVVVIGAVVKFGAFILKFFGIFLAVGGYALIWGWSFAVGVVLLILVHELGHYVEARRHGLDPQLPVFIPFLGAYVALRNVRFDPWVNAPGLARRARRRRHRRRSPASRRRWPSTPTCCARSPTPASCST